MRIIPKKLTLGAALDREIETAVAPAPAAPPMPTLDEMLEQAIAHNKVWFTSNPPTIERRHPPISQRMQAAMGLMPVIVQTEPWQVMTSEERVAKCYELADIFYAKDKENENAASTSGPISGTNLMRP